MTLDSGLLFWATCSLWHVAHELDVIPNIYGFH